MVYQQGTAITLTETFTVNGVPTDPTTVTFHVLWPDGSEHTYVFGTDLNVSHPGVGVYDCVLAAPQPSTGSFYYWGVGTGAVEATSEPRSFLVAGTPDQFGDAAQAGPCQSWVTAEEVADCCAAGTDSTPDYETSAFVASNLLYELSGHQFPGVCGPVTVRPCAPACSCRRLGVWAWQGYRWECGGRPCGCQPVSRVRLPGYPIRSIIEVKIDGAVVAADRYRLDEERYLTRMRDPAQPATPRAWPGCQTMDLEDTEEGTFSVTYWFGREPTVDAKAAAAELACQVFLACDDGADSDCVLPSNVTQVTRQGITYDVAAFTAWGRDPATGAWKTGLALVDAFLSARNPLGIRRGPAIWSPDVEPFGRRAG